MLRRFWWAVSDDLRRHRILTLPRSVVRDSLRPYAVGGLGLIHASSRMAEVLSSTAICSAWCWRGAIGPLTDRTSLAIRRALLPNLSQGGCARRAARRSSASWRATVGVTYATDAARPPRPHTVHRATIMR